MYIFPLSMWFINCCVVYCGLLIVALVVAGLVTLHYPSLYMRSIFTGIHKAKR